jgi:hypothetical protein
VELLIFFMLCEEVGEARKSMVIFSWERAKKDQKKLNNASMYFSTIGIEPLTSRYK